MNSSELLSNIIFRSPNWGGKRVVSRRSDWCLTCHWSGGSKRQIRSCHDTGRETHLARQPLAGSLPVMLSNLLLDVYILIMRHWDSARQISWLELTDNLTDWLVVGGAAKDRWQSRHYCCYHDGWMFPRPERSSLINISPSPSHSLLSPLYSPAKLGELAGWLGGSPYNNNLVIISTLGIVILFLHQGETLVNCTEYNSLDNDNKIHFPRFIISYSVEWFVSKNETSLLEWSIVGLAQIWTTSQTWTLSGGQWHGHPVCWITITPELSAVRGGESNLTLISLTLSQLYKWGWEGVKGTNN